VSDSDERGARSERAGGLRAIAEAPALASAEAQGLAGLAGVLARTGDGITVIDADRRYVYANPAACRVLGQPIEELLGRDFLDSFAMGEHVRILARLPTHVGEAAAPFFCVLRGSDDVERDVMCVTFALDITADSHCVVILRDLTGPGVAARTANALAQSAQLLGSGTPGRTSRPVRS